MLLWLLYCCSCYLNDDKDVMGCPARREEVGLCLVSMMAVRSLYCRNHSSHLRRLISSVDLTIIHTPPPSSQPTTAPKRSIASTRKGRTKKGRRTEDDAKAKLRSIREGRTEDGRRTEDSTEVRHSINSGRPSNDYRTEVSHRIIIIVVVV